MVRKSGCEGWLHQGLEQQRTSVRPTSSVTMIVLLVLLGVVSCPLTAASGDSDDVACLREFKESVTDPLGYLRNWDFRGRDTNICNFIGVTCVRPDEPKVVALDLTAAGLGGRIAPNLFRKCSSLRDLNLSNNFFTGRVPPTICVHNRNLVTLDVSNNNLFEPLPVNLQKCLESHKRHTDSQPMQEIVSIEPIEKPIEKPIEEIIPVEPIEMFSDAAGRDQSAQ